MGIFDGLMKLMAGFGKKSAAPQLQEAALPMALPEPAAPKPTPAAVVAPVSSPADRPEPIAAPKALVTERQLVAMGVSSVNAQRFAGPINFACSRFNINTPARVKMFVAQCMAETVNFALLKEGMNYSAQRLTEVWKEDFPTLASTAGYAGNPTALAEKKYGNIYGNSAPGDGLKYCGRGLLQLTFKGNFVACAAATGLDCVNHPELLETPDGAAISAAWFFSAHGCNEMSDANTFECVEPVSRRINGGTNGLKTRQANWQRGKGIFV